jgi:hypothetical protein
MDDPTPTADNPSQPPRRFRRTRIAVSILFGVLTVALCVLWVRSYWWKDGAVWVFAPGRYIAVESDRGNLTSRFQDLRGQARFPYDGPMKLTELTFRSRWLSTSDRFKGFGWHISRDFVLIASPYWFLVLTAATLGLLTAALRPRWHFSLRTMLIATTLVAVVLGLGVWLAR